VDFDDIDDPQKAYTHLGRQAKSAFKRSQSFETLLYNLNDGTLAPCSDLREEYYSNQALGRAFLVKEIFDLSWVSLHNWLSEHNRAEKLGFDPDKFADGKQAPHRTTLSRAWNNRFSSIQDYIKNQAKWVKEIAEDTEHKHPLGSPLQPGEEDSNSPELSEQQALRGTAKDVFDELEDTIFPLLSLDRPEDPIYDEEELLELEALSGITNSAANGGGQLLGDKLNPDPSPDDPFTKSGPTGETLLEAIKPLSIKQITKMYNQAAAKLLTQAKVRDVFNLPITLAIDITYVGYYADRDELEWVRPAPPDKEYDSCFKFATAAIVDDNTHFTVALLPVGNVNHRNPEVYPGPDRAYRTGEIVRELLDIATDHIRVHTVVADREFDAGDVMKACEEHDVFYLIPAVRDIRIKRELNRMGSEVTVKEEYGIYAPVKHGPPNERVETTLVILPDPDDEWVGPSPFYTNLDVSDEGPAYKRVTKDRIERYSSRGAIETSYKKIKEFAPWTTSKAFEVRLYHFGMAAVLYNTWLLMDFFIQTRMDVERRRKPRLSATRFREFLKNRLDKLILLE
jgi:hypothetical protein